MTNSGSRAIYRLLPARFPLMFRHVLLQDLYRVRGNMFARPHTVGLTSHIRHGNFVEVCTRVFHNKAAFAVETFAQNYLKAFSPEFLFISGGGNHAHNIANFGNMYLVEAPFLFFGVLYLLMRPKKKEGVLVLGWLLIAPIAASLTKDAPHTARMFALFPIPSLLIALGVMWFVDAFPRRLRYGSIAILTILFSLNIVVYLDRYYVHLPYGEAHHWGFPYEKLATTLTEPQFRNKQVVMTGVEDSPYIYLLFYSRYDPNRYQQEVRRYPQTAEGFVHVQAFGRFTFRDIDWLNDIHTPQTLLIVKPEQVPPGIKKIYRIEQIYLPSRQPWFTIVATKVK